MNKIKKAVTYLVGASVLGGAYLYFSLPKDKQKKVKDFINGVAMKKSAMSDEK